MVGASGVSGVLPPEVLQPVLESLGSSLANAIPSCRSTAAAAEQGDAAAFRPLTWCKSSPSPGDVASKNELLVQDRTFASSNLGHQCASAFYMAKTVHFPRLEMP